MKVGRREAVIATGDCQGEMRRRQRRRRSVWYAAEADMPMKGLLHTSVFMRAILNRDGTSPPGIFVMVTLVGESKEERRLFQITDCAINIAPNLGRKQKMIENAVGLAGCLPGEVPGCQGAGLYPHRTGGESAQNTGTVMPLNGRDSREGESQLHRRGPLGFVTPSRRAAKHKKLTARWPVRPILSWFPTFAAEISDKRALSSLRICLLQYTFRDVSPYL